MISHKSLIFLLLGFRCCLFRTSVEKDDTVDINVEEKTKLQVEKYEDESYNVIFEFNNETFDFNITKKDLDVDVYIADDEGNTNISDSEVRSFSNAFFTSFLSFFRMLLIFIKTEIGFHLLSFLETKKLKSFM